MAKKNENIEEVVQDETVVEETVKEEVVKEEKTSTKKKANELIATEELSVPIYRVLYHPVLADAKRVEVEVDAKSPECFIGYGSVSPVDDNKYLPSSVAEFNNVNGELIALFSSGVCKVTVRQYK